MVHTVCGGVFFLLETRPAKPPPRHALPICLYPHALRFQPQAHRKWLVSIDNGQHLNGISGKFRHLFLAIGAGEHIQTPGPVAP
jgi:hypothetical protein